MAEKNLPIKFFAKRSKDEQEIEGGGGKPPKWVLKGNALVGRSRELQDYLNQLEPRIRIKREANNHLPIVLKAKLYKDATAKTHRSDIGELFNVRNKLNIIGFLGFNEIMIKIDDERDLELIEANLRKVERDFYSLSTAKAISAVTELSDVTPYLHLHKLNETLFKIKLIDYQDYDINQNAKRLLHAICERNGISLKEGQYSFNSNIYVAEVPTTDSINELLEFDSIFSIEDMPTYTLTQDELEEDEIITVKKPEKGREYPIVGVLDTGIAKIPQLEEWIVEEREIYYPDEYTNKTHGTMVASVLIHGDDLEGNTYTGIDGCRVFEACVYPDKNQLGIRENELIQQIEDAIRRNSHIKIWNLSLGTSDEASIEDFSDFGKALDSIQEECGVLIIKSVGNCENFKVGRPRSRISRSADSVRSLVVGSIAHAQGTHDYYPVNNPSPFTRIGPGPSFLNKPDLVHFGGNAGMHAGRMVISGVNAFGLDGKVRKTIGTSFATPRVTALAAGIFNALDEPFNALLIKALMIHNAKYPKEMEMDISDKIKLAGYGMPEHINNVLYNDPNEITLILQDRLERGQFINIMDFPFPQSMVDDNGFYYGEVTVTLVTDPILEPSQQGAEYCQSNIEVRLGSYDTKKDRDTSKATIKNPIGPDGAKNLLSDSLYSKTIMKQLDNPFKTDRVLIAYEKKYHPVKKWAINLSELTDANKEKYLKAPKQWYLKINGVYRDHTETTYEKKQKSISQDFCLIITIKDSQKKGSAYNEVSQLLENFSFVHSNVKLNNRVNIRVDNNQQNN